MKIIFNVLVALFFTTLATTGYGQKTVLEDTIIVEGVCGMCKSRIEEAAFGKGVKFVEWTNTTSALAVAYRSDKTTLAEIEDRIVAAGHSTENKHAAKEEYESLPDCCKYEHLEKH
ncbi:MAG: hypothetical protein Salg2KO_22480 [Salibacteraceae bacterium]